jgi:hypothetical protein
MVLYALCLHPLLGTLESRLARINIRGTERSSLVVAYADDVKVLVTNPEDFDTILQSVKHCERAAEALLNKHKWKALTFGNWTSPASALGIDFQEQITILGVRFASTVGTSMKASWDSVVRAVCAQVRRACARDLCLAKGYSMAKNISYRKCGTWRKIFPALTPCPTANYSVCLVYLARSATQISCYHPATPKGARRMGHTGQRAQMQGTSVQSPLDVKYERWLLDRGPDAPLEPHTLPAKPTTYPSFFHENSHLPSVRHM